MQKLGSKIQSTFQLEKWFDLSRKYSQTSLFYINIISKFLYKQMLYLFYYMFCKIRYLHVTTSLQKDRIIEVKYIYKNIPYITYLPIEKRLITKMINSSIYGIKEDLSKVKLNLQPGIQPQFTPQQLGYNRVKIEYHLEGEEVYFEKNDKIVYK